MKKRIFILMVILILLLSISIQAATQRSIQTVPRLKFSGTTANCSIHIRSGNTSDSIEVTMTLKYGGTEIASWNDSGNGSVYLSETCEVAKGRTYKLIVNATVNGVPLEMKSVSATCK